MLPHHESKKGWTDYQAPADIEVILQEASSKQEDTFNKHSKHVVAIVFLIIFTFRNHLFRTHDTQSLIAIISPPCPPRTKTI